MMNKQITMFGNTVVEIPVRVISEIEDANLEGISVEFFHRMSRFPIRGHLTPREVNVFFTKKTSSVRADIIRKDGGDIIVLFPGILMNRTPYLRYNLELEVIKNKGVSFHDN